MDTINYSSSQSLFFAHRGKKTRTILSYPVAYALATIAGILSYWGASQRPELVPQPLLAAAVVFLCIFLLLIPFTNRSRDWTDMLSPEVMGGLGFLLFIGLGAFTNHLQPGLAVNPSLFRQMPMAILLQTLAATAFFLGANAAKNRGMNSIPRQTDQKRLAAVLIAYALFAFYLTFFISRQNPAELRMATLAQKPISWLNSVGSLIVFQTLPMIVAAHLYLKKPGFLFFRYFTIFSLGTAAVFFIFSGSRTFAVEAILLLFISYFIATKKINRKSIAIVIGIGIVVLLVNTYLRVNTRISASVTLTTHTYKQVYENFLLVNQGKNAFKKESVNQNIGNNLVYHLSDNQTMAMLVRNYQYGPLFGKVLYYSIISGLPRILRPTGFVHANDLFINRFKFFKELAADAPNSPDWQITIGAMGFADFWLIGLLVYPFVLGFAIRWIYNSTVLTHGLGQAGWLLYLPLVEMLWRPATFGPDLFQSLRLLLPLAIALRWTSRIIDANEQEEGIQP